MLTPWPDDPSAVERSNRDAIERLGEVRDRGAAALDLDRAPIPGRPCGSAIELVDHALARLGASGVHRVSHARGWRRDPASPRTPVEPSKPPAELARTSPRIAFAMREPACACALGSSPRRRCDAVDPAAPTLELPMARLLDRHVADPHRRWPPILASHVGLTGNHSTPVTVTCQAQIASYNVTHEQQRQHPDNSSACGSSSTRWTSTRDRRADEPEALASWLSDGIS